MNRIRRSRISFPQASDYTRIHYEYVFLSYLRSTTRRHCIIPGNAGRNRSAFETGEFLLP